MKQPLFAQHLLPLPATPLGVGQRLACLCVAWCGIFSILPNLPLGMALLFGLMAVVLGLFSVQYNPSSWAKIALGGGFVVLTLMVSGSNPSVNTAQVVAFPLLAFGASYTYTLRQGLRAMVIGLAGLAFAFLTRPSLYHFVLGGVYLIALVFSSLRIFQAERSEDTSLRDTVRMMAGILGMGMLILITGPIAVSHLSRYYHPKSSWTGGMGDKMMPGGVDELLANPDTAFRVDFEGQPPAPDERYWRTMVLWDFDGFSWSRPRWADDTMAKPDSLTFSSKTLPWHYRVTPVSGVNPTLDGTALAPVPPQVTWTADRVLAGANKLHTETWVWAAGPIRTDGLPQLIDRDRKAALHLPDSRNPRTRDLALHWRKAYPDDAKLIEHVLEYFHDNFHYSMNVPALTGIDRVDALMFSTKTGYCEHFSSTFANIMRAAGVPTRLVVGYAGGRRNTWGDYWRVQESDAHVWDEVWLADRGWTRVDPTSVVSGHENEAPIWKAWLANDFFDWASTEWQGARTRFLRWTQSSRLSQLAWERYLPYLVPALAMIAAALGWRLWRRRMAYTAVRRSKRAWLKLVGKLRAIDPDWWQPPHEGMEDFAKRVGGGLRVEHAERLRKLAQRWNAWRFGPGGSVAGTEIDAWAREVSQFRPRAPDADPRHNTSSQSIKAPGRPGA